MIIKIFIAIRAIQWLIDGHWTTSNLTDVLMCSFIVVSVCFMAWAYLGYINWWRKRGVR